MSEIAAILIFAAVVLIIDLVISLLSKRKVPAETKSIIPSRNDLFEYIPTRTGAEDIRIWSRHRDD